MQKEHLNPKNFTHVMGAYSHGVKASVGDSDIIFVTGQIAMDKDGNAVAPGSVEKQAEFIFSNIEKILAEGGATVDDVVKSVIYVTKMSDYGKISAIRNKYFHKSKPASTLVEISRTVKEGCDVEIEVIAIKKRQGVVE